MIGMRHVTAAVMSVLLILALASYADGLSGVCREKPRSCRTPVVIDHGLLATQGAVAIGVLFATVLVANGIFWRVRYRRSDG